MKDFDLDEAKNGAALMTLSGDSAYITDYNFPNPYFPLLGIVIYNGNECRLQWTNDGISELTKTRMFDLKSLPKVLKP